MTEKRISMMAEASGRLARRRLGRASRGILAVALLALAAGRAAAVPTIDGDPSDWGLNPALADWTPTSGIQGTWPPAEADYVGGNGYVAPGWGGQLFDAEAIYFTYGNGYAYFGIVTGLPPTGASNELPGDIALDFGIDGTWDRAIETTGNNGLVAGGLYGSVLWSNGYWAITNPTAIASGTLLWSSADSLVYNAIGASHYFIEAKVPLLFLPLSESETTVFRAHWTMTCGNDAVDMDGQIAPGGHNEQGFPGVPEPATMSLLGGALVVLLRRHRRK